MDKQSFEYRTGQTQPAKSSRGIIAFLLICVIFLGGLVSVLGMMNIHLLGKLNAGDTDSPVSFAAGDTAPTVGDSLSLTVEGFRLQELPTLYQELYDLPAGLYVVDAPENGPVLPGDVLVAFDGVAVTTLEELNGLYAQKRAGDRLWFSFHREGEAFSFSTFFGN